MGSEIVSFKFLFMIIEAFTLVKFLESLLIIWTRLNLLEELDLGYGLLGWLWYDDS